MHHEVPYFMTELKNHNNQEEGLKIFEINKNIKLLNCELIRKLKIFNNHYYKEGNKWV
jgi:hypothetical protein